MHNVVRVIGSKKRIYRGTERRDRVKLNEKTLKGYVKVTRQSGVETVMTCFYNVKEGRLERVEGYNWYWLAKKNCRTVKVDNPPSTFTMPGISLKNKLSKWSKMANWMWKLVPDCWKLPS
jgi:hypothetical protein